MHAQHNISPDSYKKKNTTQLMRRASERAPVNDQLTIKMNETNNDPQTRGV